MAKTKQAVSASLLAIGIVFLIIGFVKQGMTIDFASSIFSLGVIFTISGLVARVMGKRSDKSKE